MRIEFGGFFGFVILVLDILAIIKVINSRASTLSKLIWTLVILLLPVLGLIIWFIAGPKD